MHARSQPVFRASACAHHDGTIHLLKQGQPQLCSLIREHKPSCSASCICQTRGGRAHGPSWKSVPTSPTPGEACSEA